MRRRDFMKASVGGGAASLLAANSTVAVAGKTDTLTIGAPPAVLKTYTADDHRRRLQWIGFCEKHIRSCMRKHLITGYLPAQACYNLGEYPSRTPWAPNDYDEQELDRLRDHGIQIIQLFDD